MHSPIPVSLCTVQKFFQHKQRYRLAGVMHTWHVPKMLSKVYIPISTSSYWKVSGLIALHPCQHLTLILFPICQSDRYEMVSNVALSYQPGIPRKAGILSSVYWSFEFPSLNYLFIYFPIFFYPVFIFFSWIYSF